MYDDPAQADTPDQAPALLMLSATVWAILTQSFSPTP